MGAGIAAVTGLSVVGACLAAFLFLAGALTWGVLAGADAVVMLAVALARLNGAVLQAAWTWCPRRISVVVGLSTAVFAVAAALPLFFTNAGYGPVFMVPMFGAVAVLCVGAVWGRSMPRD